MGVSTGMAVRRTKSLVFLEVRIARKEAVNHKEVTIE